MIFEMIVVLLVACQPSTLDSDPCNDNSDSELPHSELRAQDKKKTRAQIELYQQSSTKGVSVFIEKRRDLGKQFVKKEMSQSTVNCEIQYLGTHRKRFVQYFRGPLKK